MQCGLLVAHQDMFDLVLVEQGVVNVEHGSARVAEHKLDTLLLEALDRYFCTGQSHGSIIENLAG